MASSPAQSDASSLNALFQTLVEWFKKNPEAFTPAPNGLLDAGKMFPEAVAPAVRFKKVSRVHNAAEAS